MVLDYINDFDVQFRPKFLKSNKIYTVRYNVKKIKCLYAEVCDELTVPNLHLKFLQFE